MGSEWAPLEGLTQTARQMGGGTDGQRHPHTDRRRETDRWTGTGRDGQTEVLAERRRQKNGRQRLRDKKGDRVTEIEKERDGEAERQEEIKKGGNPDRQREREGKGGRRDWRLQTTNRDLMRIWKVFSPSSLPKPPGQPSLHSFHPRLSFQLLKRSGRKSKREKPPRAPCSLLLFS